MTFNPRRILRGLYTGRIVLALILFLAIVVAGFGSGNSATMIASLALVGALAFTAASFIWTDLTGHEPGPSFMYLQVAFDMLLVTAAVHATWAEGQAQLAPLYILVIAISALLVAPSGVPLIASLGMVLYFADAMLLHGGQADIGLLMQLVVFTIVALTSGFIAARLRAAGSASEKLAEELAAFRLRESDLRRLLVRAERLEGIAEMSASLAHEIKNPLASIRSAVEQLSRMPRASDDEKILSTLVQRESDRLSRVLTEFLDFARAGMTRVETLDIAAIARNAATLALAAITGLPLLVQRLLQHNDALLRLPYLVRIAVLVGRQKVLVSLKRRFGLPQLIVAECAKKQFARVRGFLLGHLVEQRQRARIVAGQIVCRRQILPVDQIRAVQAYRGP